MDQQPPTIPVAPDMSQVPPAVEPPAGFAPTQPQPKKSREGLKSVFMTLAILIIAPLVALTLTAFIFQSYEVDGPSMQTTLQNQDRLIVLKLPRTMARITGHAYVPHRGDIVIFNKNDLTELGGSSENKQLIKRVVGLPGERVVVKNGTLTVYNKDNPNGFQPDKTLPYGNVIVTTPGDLDVTVPPNQVFVCGDNRTNSLDSRYFGPIPLKDIVGKLVLRIYPFDKAKSF